MFQFFTGADPTNGRVYVPFLPVALLHIVTRLLAQSNYVSENVAQATGLVAVNGGNAIIGVDDTTYLSPTAPGRNSVRLVSNNQYNTHISM